jgi:C-terminal processing protease CtpA/Prc
MRRSLSAVLMWMALAVPGHAQNAGSLQELEGTLTFESAHSGTLPAGWGGGPPGTIAIDGAVVHAGRWSARLERTATSPEAFSTLTKSIPADFSGKTIEWRGFLRSEAVSDFMGLWMRLDGDTPSLGFASMQPRQIRGTNDWTEYSITLPLHPDAKQLFFGVLLSGTGKVWADDLRLLVDGKPVWEAPKAVRPKTALDLDHEFDAGSGVVIGTLTPVQIENLAMLGKVWGFLKYHHPAVTAGTRHWDYDLLRVLPAVLAARDRDAGSSVLREWIGRLGPLPACNPCLTLRDENLHLRPRLTWIESDTAVGRDLAGLLRTVYRSRSHGKQFFVSQVPDIGNPRFDNEPAYAELKWPDPGYQLLALYRFWNIIEYWFPYRDRLDGDWDRVLAEFVPRMALAPDKDAYQLEMMQLIARVTDTHANLWSAPPRLRPPAGDCQLPVTIRFVEHQAVVTGYSDATAGPATGLRIGDVVDSLDGVPLEQLIGRWEPYYPASNRPTRLRDIAQRMMRGACAAVGVGVRRASGRSERVTAQRLPQGTPVQRARVTNDRPGEAFQLLSSEVAYLKLSAVQVAHAASYVDRAKATRGLVIDIRNYPSEFVVFALGALLVDRPTPFARFTTGDLEQPGAFRWSDPLSITPQPPHYAGKVVILVDESSQSQAEYTAMAFRASPRAVVVGSTTAGADGNVSPVPLPGGLSSMISGIGVFYPDKAPTQRIGIVPDVEVRPTIAGIRAGRDEVLEEALRQILGREVPAEQIERMAKPRP